MVEILKYYSKINFENPTRIEGVDTLSALVENKKQSS